VIADLPPFRPRFPWWGGDLQTLVNRLNPPRIDLAPHRTERLAFAMPDGTGDVLLASLDRSAHPTQNRPLVILIHGLTGAEDSLYLLSQSRLLLDRGSNVLRLNLRGAGPSRATCAGQYYAGRSQDFRAVLAVLPPDQTRHGIAAVGYSLGGAMLLKYLGEEGAADDPPHATRPNSNRQQNQHSPTMVRRFPTRCDNNLIPTRMRNRRLGSSGVYLKK